ncbi:hypothetical protein QL285_064937 [Trifolium repens]|nr:hypothetical protein QL285_064937 [Trifolium repens]
MKYVLIFYREFFYDHGGFLPPPLSHHGGDGWLLIVHGVIMVVVGGFFSCTIDHGGSFIYERLLLLARAMPSGCDAFFFHFPPNLLFELHGLETGSSCYWAYAIYFWAIV